MERHIEIEETIVETVEILSPAGYEDDVGQAANRGFSADAAYRRWDRDIYSAEIGIEDNGMSWYSDTPSSGIFFRALVSPAGSDGYPSSSRVASTLPEYTVNTRSPAPPRYSNLSRSQSQTTDRSGTVGAQ
jgi:hypothetical protein